MNTKPNAQNVDKEEAEFLRLRERSLLLAGWPPALIKALADPFSYACGLKSGLEIKFERATDHANGWVTLCGVSGWNHFNRGIDVRVSEIAWAADAPEGS